MLTWRNASMKLSILLSVQALVFSALARPVNLHCCIVRSEDGELSNPTSALQISNDLEEVNRVFRQVAMSFRLDSCVHS